MTKKHRKNSNWANCVSEAKKKMNLLKLTKLVWRSLAIATENMIGTSLWQDSTVELRKFIGESINWSSLKIFCPKAEGKEDEQTPHQQMINGSKNNHIKCNYYIEIFIHIERTIAAFIIPFNWTVYKNKATTIKIYRFELCVVWYSYRVRVHVYLLTLI